MNAKLLKLRQVLVPCDPFHVAAADLLDDLVNAQGKMVTLIDGATITWNVFEGLSAKVTLAGSRTINLVNVTRGDVGIIKITQDGTGSRTLTLGTVNADASITHKVANGGSGAITLSSDPASVDLVSFWFDGVSMNWTVSPNFT